MTIYPAVDIKGGKCVRLLKGLMDAETVYSDNPVDFAKKWEDEGATHLHVVDLDGAINGRLVNLAQLENIRKSTKLFIEFGGGVRSSQIIDQLLAAGVDRIIVGTKAISDAIFIEAAAKSYGDKIAVSLDANGNKLAAKGWVEETNEMVVETAKKLERFGVQRFIYTQISRDGTLGGPDIDGLKNLASQISVPVIASGGIGSIDDIKKIMDIEYLGIDGVIVGKALYEEKVDLAEAIKIALKTEEKN